MRFACILELPHALLYCTKLDGSSLQKNVLNDTAIEDLG